MSLLIKCYFVFSAVCSCCKLNLEDYIYTTVEHSDYTPDDHIIISDKSVSPNKLPNVSSIRPNNDEEGVKLWIPSSNSDPIPYVEIDIDEPGVENSTVYLLALRLPGTVSQVKIQIKTNHTSTKWKGRTLNVTDDGNVDWPPAWQTGPYGFVPVDKIIIKPLAANQDSDGHQYVFKVYLIGCSLGNWFSYLKQLLITEMIE